MLDSCLSGAKARAGQPGDLQTSRCASSCNRALRSAPAGIACRTSRRNCPRSSSHGPRSAGQLRVDLAAQALRQRRTLARRRNSNLQIAPLHDRSEKEVAQGRIVGGVAQDRAARGFFKDGPIDLAIVGGGNDEIATGSVLGLISGEPATRSRPCELSCWTRATAWGATTRMDAPQRSRLSTFSRPIKPAPTTRHRFPSSFRNKGKRLSARHSRCLPPTGAGSLGTASSTAPASCSRNCSSLVRAK